MSQPRTRSQGLPDTEVREDIGESAIPGSSPTERRMSRELEVLKLYPAQKDKEGETSQMQPELTRSTSETLRPPSTIPPALRANSALGIVILGEVSTKFNQYHIVPIHNSKVDDGKQKHTTGLTIPRNQDNDETDLEVAEIVVGTASSSPSSRPEEASPDNFFNASDKPMDMESYRPNKSTMPAVNTFVTIRGEDEWLKRYLPDDHNSQIGNVPNRVEITTENGEEWCRTRLPYLERFYNTGVYLVGKQNDTTYALRGEEKEMVCVRIL